MQAMERDRNEPPPERPRHPRDRAQPHSPDTPASDDVMRWVAAGVVSTVALLGLVVLVAIAAYFLQPPRWLQIVLGVVMAAGTAAFAWVLAAALRKASEGRAAVPPRRR